MAALPVGKKHYARANPAQHSGYLEAVLERVLQAPIGKIECLTMRDLQDLRGFRGFGLALGGGAPGSGLALGEVEDAGG